MKNLNKFISMIIIIGLIFGSFIVTGCQVEVDDPVEPVAPVVTPTDPEETPSVDPEKEDEETTEDPIEEVNDPTENNEVDNPIDETEDDPEESSDDPENNEDPEEEVVVHEPVIISLWKSSFNDSYDNRYSIAEVYTSDGELRAKVTTNNEGKEVNYDFKVDTDNITYREFTYDIRMEYELNETLYKAMSDLEDMMDESNYEERSAIVYPKTYEFRLISADDPNVALCVSDHLFNRDQYAPLIDNPLPMDDCIDPDSYTTYSFYKFVVNGYIKNYKKNTYSSDMSNFEKLMSSIGESVGGITDYIFDNYTVTLEDGNPTIFDLNRYAQFVYNRGINIMEQFWDE